MPAVGRLHALDAVRAYALLLGVVLHSAASFLEGFPMPLWVDKPSATAAVIYYVIHMFRMSAFFLIAGFFARMVVERRGVKAFIKDRAKRIGLPLLAFPLVMAVLGVGALLGAIVAGSMPILLASYHYLVRFTWIGAILNGRRQSRPGKPPPADAAPAAG